ncbi:hypothetical protein PTTG_12273 [Puccinia triticina 1-1 BBBD Race 1]|uniref:Uncharacterized protein n=1 Tax=Puccinia triticina (isolate 1-1 / race 1 (BBBD)) TaxID=630390 RepID=A0A180G639_PUCT1|nr:hypothetical protein PTTG_12273 [Puccinia triticina 1-1 BBBD Race 1]
MSTSASPNRESAFNQALTTHNSLTWNRQTKTIFSMVLILVTSIVLKYSFYQNPTKDAHQHRPSSQRVVYAPPKPVFRNQTDPVFRNQTNMIPVQEHCNFVEAMMKIETKIDTLTLEEIGKFRARLDLADNEPSSEIDSQNLGQLWQMLAVELHSLVHHSHVIEVNGKWEMQLLFEEYYAFNQANLAARIDYPTLMMVNLIRIVNSLLGSSDQISRGIQDAFKANSQVRRLLYSKEKKLSNTINQSGILPHGLRFIFGDMWIRQRKFELQLVHEGISLSQEISHTLGQFELSFKLFSEAGKLILGSVDRVMQESQPTKAIRSLVMLFSILKCAQGSEVFFKYVDVGSPISIDS